MMGPIRFLRFVLGVAFTIGLVDGFRHVTYGMASAAMHAQEHDQLSYAQFNRLLWSQGHTHKEREKKKPPQ
jgi:hypothetical protein